MKRLLACVLLGLALDAGAAAPGAGDPAVLRFDYAHYLMSSADDALAQGDKLTARLIYEEAVTEYGKLMREFPDWEPAATRFRWSHCLDKLRRLRPETDLPPPPPTATNPPAAVADEPPPIQPVPDEETPPSDAETLRILKADARKAMRSGDARTALALLVDALRVNPDDHSARLLTATAHCQLADYGNALQLLDPLADEAPGNPDIQIVMSAAYLGLGMTDEAQACLRRAIELDPDSGPANYNMAHLLLMIGDPDGEARTYYERAVANGAEPDPAFENGAQ